MSYFYLREKKRKFLFDLWKKMMKNICIAQTSILDISFLSDWYFQSIHKKDFKLNYLILINEFFLRIHYSKYHGDFLLYKFDLINQIF